MNLFDRDRHGKPLALVGSIESLVVLVYYRNDFCSKKMFQSLLSEQLTGPRRAVLVFSGRTPKGMAPAGARAAKREVRVCARGCPSSHATMRSILIAAAMATCCKWVFARPQYLVRRRPKARTPCESVPSMPARCAYCALPSALADQALAAATASASARGGSLSRRPRCLARVHAARTGHGAHVC